MTNIKIELSALTEDQKDWENQFDEGFFHYMETGEEHLCRQYGYRDKSNPITIEFQINDVEHEVKIQTDWKDMGGKDGILEPKRYLWFEILDQDQNLSLENVNYLKNYIIEFLQRNFGTSTFDDENYPVEYGASRSFSYDSNKKWSFSFSVKTVISQKSRYHRPYPCMTPTQMLRHAIRERDEKIAAKEARKRAEEEAEIARIKAIEDANRKNYEEFKNFVNEIGDFELNEGHCTSFGDGGWKPLRDFAFTWNNDDKCSYRRCDGREFSFHASDLDWHKNEVVRWAVENGVRAPQQACV
jgi:hypothetical protein